MISSLNIKIGMPEIMVITGAFLLPQAKWIAISLIIAGVLSRFLGWCTDRSDAEDREKTVAKLMKDCIATPIVTKVFPAGGSPTIN